MAGLLLGDPSHHGMVDSGSHNFSHDNLEDPNFSSSNWYFCRKEIEENSPSRRDGIDLKKETYFRKSYCTFLQDLGMRLKVPQVTIATAIIFCHRFFHRQSHAKNDRRTIATVCMFLAGKVEETPRPLKDVILVSYEIIHKKDPAAVQRIKQKEVYEQQKELILIGERVVLATLGFDLNVHHPYKPLVEAIKKFKVAQNALAQVAWNFVNDGLRTSLCLQFKPHHIAAGAIFLAAKFLKVKLPSDGEKVWWQEFDVTPRQLEEVSNQMLELYEQNRTAQPSHGSEIEGSVGGGANHRNPDKNPTIEEQAPPNGHSHGPGQSEIPRISQEEGGDRGVNLGNYASQSGPPRTMINQSNDYGSKDHRHHDQDHFSGARDPENMMEALSKSKPGAEDPGDGVAPKGYRPPDVIRKIDKDKVKAALEKRRKSRGDVTKKTDLMDDDDLIERELESGVELAAQERRQGWSNKPLHKPERDNKKRSRSLESEELGELGDAPAGVDENSEEGELSFDALETCSPRSGGGTWSERGGGSPNRPVYGKNQYQHHHHEPLKPVTGKGRDDHTERDLKRHRQ